MNINNGDTAFMMLATSMVCLIPFSTLKKE